MIVEEEGASIGHAQTMLSIRRPFRITPYKCIGVIQSYSSFYD